MKYIIATADSRRAKYWKNAALTWDEITERLSKTTRTAETAGHFLNMSKAMQDDVKDVGGFVGGRVKDGRRKAGNIEYRSLITLDADFAGEDFTDILDLTADYAYCLYSTHKHTPEKPRLRLVIPLSRTVTPDEYEAIARITADDIGIERFDDTTYQAHRLMYWPSTSIDGEFVFRKGEGAPLDADVVLRRYGDWRDVSQWPVSSRTVKVLDRKAKKQEDPTLKRGIVGAFCRAYSVEEAIAEFIPDVYEKCGEGRYTYTAGSSAGGLVLYEGGKFAYSNHATDPASQILTNAFDLVRIHRFGELDAEMKDGTPQIKSPSYMAMCRAVSEDKRVKEILFKEAHEAAMADFADGGQDSDTAWAQGLEMNAKGAYERTIQNVLLILTHDSTLKGKIYQDDFAETTRVDGVLPWDEAAEEKRAWRDSDTDGLVWYLEHVYKLPMGADKVYRALSVFCRRAARNPVKDYLNSLEWDGVQRVGTLFCDYLGAERSPYTAAAAKAAFTAAAARVYEPGLKFDVMPILSGPQGIGKSTLLRKMGRGVWFTDAIRTFDGKDLCEVIQGKWIIEISELEALNRVEVGRVKQILSQNSDRYRAAYGRVVEEHPRKCVFFGTSNDFEYLRDQTGSRRFWPIDTGLSKPKKSVFTDLDAEADQLWAECVHLYKAGELRVLERQASDLAAGAQEMHRERSSKEGLIKEFVSRQVPSDWQKRDLSERRLYWLSDGEGTDDLRERDKVCALEIWAELFGGDIKAFRRQDAREINGILQRLPGWERARSNLFCGCYGHQKGFSRV